MTGLKSGTGDDLWGDDADEADESESGATEERSTEESDTERTTNTESEHPTGDDATSTGSDHPYIVRRTMQDKGIQFERDERLTIFVHDDVADAEREVLAGVLHRARESVANLPDDLGAAIDGLRSAHGS